MNGRIELKPSKHDPSFYTTHEMTKKYGISGFTLRTWRRGWYATSAGKFYFFQDHSYLPHGWCNICRRYEYNPVTAAVWVAKLREKKRTRKVKYAA